MLIAVTSTSVLCVYVALHCQVLSYIAGARMALAHCAMNQHQHCYIEHR